MKRIKNWFKKLWQGECPKCHIALEEVKGWARSDCPKCKEHYNWF